MGAGESVRVFAKKEVLRGCNGVTCLFSLVLLHNNHIKKNATQLRLCLHFFIL